MTQESTNLKFRFFELCHFLCNKGFKLCHFPCHFPGQTINFVSFPVLGNDTKLIFVSFWFISRSVNYLCHFLCHFLSFPVSFPVSFPTLGIDTGNDTSVIQRGGHTEYIAQECKIKVHIAFLIVCSVILYCTLLLSKEHNLQQLSIVLCIYKILII